MKSLIVICVFFLVFEVSAQPFKPEEDEAMNYMERIVLNCQANLSSLYQERSEMVDEMEKGKKQALESLTKLGLKNPDVNLEKIPPVLSIKLDLEHARAMEKNEDEFLEWESRFFMTNAQEYMKDCVAKTIEIHKDCSKNKKMAKICLEKKMSSLKDITKKHIPFLMYLEENSKNEKKSKKDSKKKIISRNKKTT